MAVLAVVLRFQTSLSFSSVEGVGSGVVPLSLMVPVMVTLRVVTPPPLTVSVAL